MTDSKTPELPSSKPYLISAMCDWIIDGRCTPYILVDAYMDGVEVPQDFVKDGQIVLNISPGAVTGFNIDKKKNMISFSAKFNKIAMNISVPIAAVLGIYARENGQGMMFDPEDRPGPEDTPPSGPKLVSKKDGEVNKVEVGGKPSLRVVK